MSKTLRRELYAVAHAQSARFRIFKYLILLLVIALLYHHHGLSGVFYFLGFAVIAGICSHFIFRYKTNAWTKSWGLYRAMKLPK